MVMDIGYLLKQDEGWTVEHRYVKNDEIFNSIVDVFIFFNLEHYRI
jgi:hypothetical protein